jgi:hypothetical protein
MGSEHTLVPTSYQILQKRKGVTRDADGGDGIEHEEHGN